MLPGRSAIVVDTHSGGACIRLSPDQNDEPPDEAKAGHTPNALCTKISASPNLSQDNHFHHMPEVWLAKHYRIHT